MRVGHSWEQGGREQLHKHTNTRTHLDSGESLSFLLPFGPLLVLSLRGHLCVCVCVRVRACVRRERAL